MYFLVSFWFIVINCVKILVWLVFVYVYVFYVISFDIVNVYDIIGILFILLEIDGGKDFF